eukprot:532117-Amorphochlora_amoeboformis.AAC.1
MDSASALVQWRCTSGLLDYWITTDNKDKFPATSFRKFLGTFELLEHTKIFSGKFWKRDIA